MQRSVSVYNNMKSHTLGENKELYLQYTYNKRGGEAVWRIVALMGQQCFGKELGSIIIFIRVAQDIYQHVQTQSTTERQIDF